MDEGEGKTLRGDKEVKVERVGEGEEAFGTEEGGEVRKRGRERFKVGVAGELFGCPLEKLYSSCIIKISSIPLFLFFFFVLNFSSFSFLLFFFFFFFHFHFHTMYDVDGILLVML